MITGIPLRAFVALLFSMAPGLQPAPVRLANILGDHMVVQRGMPVHVWGTAPPGQAVSISFRGATRSGNADELGKWSVYLPPGEAGGPFELTVQGPNTITLHDVFAGDVWIAAGQSNMEWPVRWAADAERERSAANIPNLRLVRTMHRVRDFPMDDFVGTPWVQTTPESVEHFSAAGYHFGRLLHERLGVAIGVIQTAWGGTPAEAWTSLRGIAQDPGLMPIFAEWARVSEGHEAALTEHRRRMDEWARVAAQAKAASQQPPEPPELRTGPGGPWTPAGLFNSMVAPLTKLPVRGVIWYQGEANTSPERAPLYERLFPALIQDWRRAWGQNGLPFLFVQLANYGAEPGKNWPVVREAQRRALALRNTAMAVAIDIGTPDDIYPRNKRDVATRLALAARALVYGERVEYSGPLFRQAAAEVASMRVWFDHAAGLRSRSGSVRTFELAGRDGVYHPAEAKIDGETVVVTSASVPAPVYVRYAWANNPEATLMNGAGLPASPFQSGVAER